MALGELQRFGWSNTAAKNLIFANRSGLARQDAKDVVQILVMDPGLLLAALDPIGPSSRWPIAHTVSSSQDPR